MRGKVRVGPGIRVGKARVPPSLAAGHPSPASEGGRDPGTGAVDEECRVSEVKVPPSLAFGHPSPAASHAREGRTWERRRADVKLARAGQSAPLPGRWPSLPRTRGRDVSEARCGLGQGFGWARQECPPPWPLAIPPPRLVRLRYASP
jgi:hypothetical protein